MSILDEGRTNDDASGTLSCINEGSSKIGGNSPDKDANFGGIALGIPIVPICYMTLSDTSSSCVVPILVKTSLY